MSKYYEIVVWTAALKDYADWIIDKLDTSANEGNPSIKYRLYRDHTVKTSENTYIKVLYTLLFVKFEKNLLMLGRNLNKVIIVDNCAQNFSLSPNNGILI